MVLVETKYTLPKYKLTERIKCIVFKPDYFMALCAEKIYSLKL